MNRGLPMDAIVLPNGAHVPAIAGKCRLVPPPDLNDLVETCFLLEYDFPFLLVQELATRQSSEKEKGEAVTQARLWERQHTEGHVSYDRGGYQFNEPSSSRNRGCYHRQFIPGISYADGRTWSRLSDEEKDKAYLPCVPAVVIELMSATDKMEDLQAKVTKFVDAGTREGVVVDTRRDQVWIYNRNHQPYLDALAPIEFDSWPGFTLDCVAIRDARTRAGLKYFQTTRKMQTDAKIFRTRLHVNSQYSSKISCCIINLHFRRVVLTFSPPKSFH